MSITTGWRSRQGKTRKASWVKIDPQSICDRYAANLRDFTNGT
ncbi:hypothetical protein [Myxosarcina sp. GI1(2024)]